ncbi:hypothetical protein ACIQOW_05180 [Kitasatospora sp. NPDC091335]|uniref:hypothetical protein n=1 Tax=Kitasatospora sp. NPDC091335 TaxID=3364085 RepID=UPI00382C0C19
MRRADNRPFSGPIGSHGGSKGAVTGTDANRGSSAAIAAPAVGVLGSEADLPEPLG